MEMLIYMLIMLFAIRFDPIQGECTDTEVIYYIENVTGRDVAYIQRWASTLDKGSTNQSTQLVHINSFCIFCK